MNSPTEGHGSPHTHRCWSMPRKAIINSTKFELNVTVLRKQKFCLAWGASNELSSTLSPLSTPFCLEFRNGNNLLLSSLSLLFPLCLFRKGNNPLLLFPWGPPILREELLLTLSLTSIVSVPLPASKSNRSQPVNHNYWKY